MNANSLSNQHDAAPRPIYDITPFSSLDYPDHLSAIIWFAGCNMRCRYCYNPDIVNSKGGRSLEEAIVFLKKRVGLLDGVVLSGGEATGFKGLEEFCRQIKALGFKIKLDTNGTYPQKLETLIDGGLLDYVALDYKGPQNRFFDITHNRDFASFEESLVLLLKEDCPFEVRTTVHGDLLSEKDINTIINDLERKGYTGTYYLQNFVDDVETLGNIRNPKKTFDRSKIISNLPIEYR